MENGSATFFRNEATTTERVVFTVERGVKHKVVAVDLKGNKYFSDCDRS